MKLANPYNDEFNCEERGEVFDIEESIKTGGKYLCAMCAQAGGKT